MISKRRPPVGDGPLIRPAKPSEIGASLVGERLGHFQLEEFIGGGGMGAVFRALDTSLGRTVAVKVVSSDNTDEETLRRFRNEAQSAARLDHPNIARVYAVGEDKSWNYIVFEYIEGVNIRDLVEHKGPLPIEEAISYTLQMAEALDHASQRDVVHRDIKPSNILVMPDGRAKLVDMGLARLHHVDAPSNDLTATGVTLGTFDYISPEQARDPRSADVRSDLYSLGCTLYYMLTGMPPFPEGTVLQKLLSHSSDRPPDPREVRPDVGDDLGLIALKLMAKQPGQRYPTPRGLTNDLLVVAERLGLSGLRGAPSMSVGPRPWLAILESHLPWAVPLATLIAVVFALDFVWRMPEGQDLTMRRPILSTRVEAAEEPDEPPAAEEPAAAADIEPAPSAKRLNETPAPAKGGETRAAPPEAKAAPTVSPTPSRDPPAVPQTTAPAAATPAATPPAATPPPAVEPRPPAVAAENPEPGGKAPAAPASGLPVVPAAPAVASRLIVGLATETDPPGSVFASLDAAFRAAAERDEVTTLELRFHDRVELPCTVNLRRELTVRPAEGYEPLIIFRPATSEIAVAKPMIKLMGGSIKFERVHFRVELPYDVVEGCELFRLYQVENISLVDCTMTFRSDFEGTASFFAVQGPRERMAMPEEPAPPVNSPYIGLTRCIARGRATLVRAVEGSPFWLSWDQGLFSSSQRLVEAGGLRRLAGAERISIETNHVTMSVEDGLCLVQIDERAPMVPSVFVNSKWCVVRSGSGGPLFEHVGVESVETAQGRLARQGEHNVYEAGTDVVWTVKPLADDVVSYRWDHQVAGFEERSAERQVRWAADHANRSLNVYEHTPQDFQLEETQPDREQAGFDVRVLPVPREPNTVPLQVAPEAEAARLDRPTPL